MKKEEIVQLKGRGSVGRHNVGEKRNNIENLTECSKSTDLRHDSIVYSIILLVQYSRPKETGL